MSVEIHIEWEGETHLVGRLHTAERSAAVSFEYTADWLGRTGAFAIDPTSLPLRDEPPQLADFGLCSPLHFCRLPPMISRRALALAVACLAIHFIRDREHGRVLESLRELPRAPAADVVGNEAGQHGREA